MSDGLFAQFETNFMLTDSRLDGMSDGAFRVYMTLWALAVHKRRETLWFAKGASSIAHACRKDARSIPAALASLQQLCLIEIIDEKTIKVCGVKNKHPRLRWKDDDLKNLKKSSDADIDIEVDIDIDKEIDIDIREEESPDKSGSPRLQKFYQAVIQIDYSKYKDLGLSKVDYDFEIKKMAGWIEANPRKGNKSNYGRFIHNWLIRRIEDGKQSKRGGREVDTFPD